MAKKRAMDPLRAEEIKVIQNRRTETVLRAVLRYADKDVNEAVSAARKFLRGEEEEELSEDKLALLAKDEIDFPTGLYAEQRDARFGRQREDRGVIESGFDGLIDSNFIAGEQQIQAKTGLGEHSQAARKRRLPQKAKNDPVETVEETVEETETPSTPQPTSRREARRLLTRRTQEDEEVLNTPVDDDAYSFLDEDTEAEATPIRSLLIPEEDFWDDDEDEQNDEQDIPMPTRTIERREISLDDDFDDDPDFDLWEIPEDDKPVKKRSNSLDSIMDQFGLEDI